MQPSENRQTNKERHDALSIPGYVIKKNPNHGARHGPSVRQHMYFEARDMLRKAKKKKCTTILERWDTDELYQNSLTAIGWTRDDIENFDEIALTAKSVHSDTRRKRTY